MTLFAGAFALDPAIAIAREFRGEIMGSLGSSRSGSLQVHDSDRLFLAKWDSGAFAEPAWLVSAGRGVRALVGDPLLLEGGRRVSRERQLARLVTEDGRVQRADLASTRGSFSLVGYCAREERVTLATDTLGLRSTYYVVQDGILVFATALRILEGIRRIRKRLSILGMAEIGTFEFPLGCRTPYEEVSILREAQVLSATRAGIEIESYYDWSAVRTVPRNQDESAARIHEVFKQAIRARAGTDRRAYAFLSGGMDSRAIVSTLIGEGIRVEALNFSPPKSQDQRFAQRFAQEAGEDSCRLHCADRTPAPNFSLLALAAKRSVEAGTKTGVDRPAFIWSGDGGSVGLGHVYMDEKMLELAASADLAETMRHFLRINRYSPSLRTMTAAARRSLDVRVLESVLEEVNRYPRDDVGRRIYLFLMFNDQRRHLFKHFETIDQHGLELLTPFYDTELVQAISDLPAEWGILHRQYSRLFQLLPEFARRSPWQTYPGHEPCPVASDEELSYQWAGRGGLRSESLRERSRLAWRVVRAFDGRVDPPVFSRARVMLAALLHGIGARDCRHLLGVLEAYRDYQSRTSPG